MLEKQKVWIKGNKEHPEKVIHTLSNLGGDTLRSFCIGNNDRCVYFISHTGIIDCYNVYEEVEASKIVMENYKEIKIEDIQI